MKNFTIGLIGALILLFGLGTLFYFSEKSALAEIDSFEDCRDNGYQVENGECSTPDGRVFLEKGESKQVLHSKLRVVSPAEGEVITSPLGVHGEAVGDWFFDAEVFIRLLDAEEREVASSYARAAEDQQTTNSVYFEGEVVFGTVETATGTLVVESQELFDPQESNSQVIIPVTFEMTGLEEPEALLEEGNINSTDNSQ